MRPWLRDAEAAAMTIAVGETSLQEGYKEMNVAGAGVCEALHIQYTRPVSLIYRRLALVIVGDRSHDAPHYGR